MGKLKGDVPAPNKEDPAGKFIELQELFARRKQLLAGNLQVRRLLPRRDDDKTRLQYFVSHLNCFFTDETRAAMKRHDARFREAFFTLLGNGLGESTLEAHQFTPINRKLLGPNSIAFHPALPIEHFGRAYQHLFRIASPQRARATEWSGINYRDLPSCCSTPRCHGRRRSSRSDRHNVKLFGHFFFSSKSVRRDEIELSFRRLRYSDSAMDAQIL